MAALQISVRSTPLRNAVEKAMALVEWALTVSSRGTWARSYVRHIAEMIHLEMVWELNGASLEEFELRKGDVRAT